MFNDDNNLNLQVELALAAKASYDDGLFAEKPEDRDEDAEILSEFGY
jgi:hypothetical protein